MDMMSDCKVNIVDVIGRNADLNLTSSNRKVSAQGARGNSTKQTTARTNYRISIPLLRVCNGIKSVTMRHESMVFTERNYS